MIRYLTLSEYFWLAEQVTGTDAGVLAKVSRSDLADSALHAPKAGFGDEEFYPDIYEKAAVLLCRLAWNQPSSGWKQTGGMGLGPNVHRAQRRPMGSGAAKF
jgi:death-on-curing protein